MKIMIDISEGRYKDIRRIAEVQLERNHFQTAEQIIANGVPVNTSGDCISRQAAIDAIGNVPDHDDGMVWEALSHAQWNVALLPLVTQQPEVIRCKDCKHWTNNIGDSELRDNYCNEEAHGFYYRCSGDDYCSFAERRTDE